MKRKVCTNLVVFKDGKVLLGYKKRGFGEGAWNSFGGKVAEDETIEQSALRELKEEVMIEAVVYKKMGVLIFEYPDEDSIMESHVFGIYDFNGEPAETEEMACKWFEIDDVPYDIMWPDDIYWLPLFFEGKSFFGKFIFNNRKIIDFELNEVSDIAKLKKG